MTRQHNLPHRFASTRTTVALSMGVLMTLSSLVMGRAEHPAVDEHASSVPSLTLSPALSPTLQSGSLRRSLDNTSLPSDSQRRHSNSPFRAPTRDDDAMKDRKPQRDLDNSEKRARGVVYVAPEAHPLANSDSSDTRAARTKNRRAAHPHRRFHHSGSHSRQMRSRQMSKRTYSLVDSFEGSTFFDGWDFFDHADPTHGMITYVSAAEAFSDGLAYVQEDGAAVMTVDTKSTLNSGGYRKSVRITSKKSYSKGLFVFDILKAPHGCAVWPAAWLVGPNWPHGGEIDVIEGVHDNTVNQLTLHTSPGCMLDTTKTLAGGIVLAAGMDASDMFTGTPLEADCDATINSNSGCGVLDFDPRSYGSGLNNAGGAVYATLWDDSGVRIWFFSRDAVPVDITGKVPDPSTWGSPKAYWPASSCASSFFSDLSVVFDIVLGGDWAGATFSQAGCPGTVADYISDPSNFASANWVVNSVRIYQ